MYINRKKDDHCTKDDISVSYFFSQPTGRQVRRNLPVPYVSLVLPILPCLAGPLKVYDVWPTSKARKNGRNKLERNFFGVAAFFSKTVLAPRIEIVGCFFSLFPVHYPYCTRLTLVGLLPYPKTVLFAFASGCFLSWVGRMRPEVIGCKY